MSDYQHAFEEVQRFVKQFEGLLAGAAKFKEPADLDRQIQEAKNQLSSLRLDVTELEERRGELKGVYESAANTVEAAKAEAERIVAEANAKGRELEDQATVNLRQARAQAAEIVALARYEAQELVAQSKERAKAISEETQNAKHHLDSITKEVASKHSELAQAHDALQALKARL